MAARIRSFLHLFVPEHGGNPLVQQGKAIDAYLAAIHLDERQAEAWINLGGVYRKRASTPNAKRG